jgi:hypothetical protein
MLLRKRHEPDSATSGGSQFGRPTIVLFGMSATHLTITGSRPAELPLRSAGSTCAGGRSRPALALLRAGLAWSASFA